MGIVSIVVIYLFKVRRCPIDDVRDAATFAEECYPLSVAEDVSHRISVDHGIRRAILCWQAQFIL